MKFEGKTKKALFIAAAIIYVAMFVCAVVCACWTYNVKKQACGGKCGCVSQCSDNKPKKVMKSIDECLEILAPAKDAMGKCEWLALNDSAQQVSLMENYHVAETKEISPEILQKILDKKFYEDKGEVINYGMYIPMARVSYKADNGRDVAILYSFSNAQFNLYRNNEMVKEGILFDANELEALLESI